MVPQGQVHHPAAGSKLLHLPFFQTRCLPLAADTQDSDLCPSNPVLPGSGSLPPYGKQYFHEEVLPYHYP